jgi:glycerol-3-phosphate acyltransferase PlsY
MSLLPEIQRKAIHLTFILIPLIYHYELLPKWFIVRGLLVATLLSIIFELARLHDARVRKFFRQFFHELIRSHEHKQLLGSTYLLIAAVLTIEIFSEPIAVSALGALILGDTAAALVGKTLGKARIFGKSLEGSAACFIVSFLFAWGVVGLDARTAAIGMLTATLFELLPIPLDDNFRIPLSAGFAMKFFGA